MSRGKYGGSWNWLLNYMRSCPDLNNQKNLCKIREGERGVHFHGPQSAVESQGVPIICAEFVRFVLFVLQGPRICAPILRLQYQIKIWGSRRNGSLPKVELKFEN